jgi:MarR family transcriptional regulator, organic hydroperoxide resistance regulator
MARDVLSEPMGHLLSQVCRLTHARMYTMVDRVGLHRGQSLVLKALWGQEGLTHRELAERLYVRSSTMTHMIRRMETAGFVERRADALDRRVSRVYLTDRGRELQSQVQEIWWAFEGRVFAGLGSDEIGLMRQCFLQIRDNLIEMGEACEAEGAGAHGGAVRRELDMGLAPDHEEYGRG